MPEIIEQPFRLYQGDPVIAVADGTVNLWSDIWKYQVPVGVSLILKPNHTFSLYSVQVDTESLVTTQVKIEKRDSSESDIIKVLSDLYGTVKEFQEKSKMATLQVPAEGVIVNEREFLVISILDKQGAIDESDCYFELHIAKVRKALGA